MRTVRALAPYVSLVVLGALLGYQWAVVLLRPTAQTVQPANSAVRISNDFGPDWEVRLMVVGQEPSLLATSSKGEVRILSIGKTVDELTKEK